MNTKGKNQEGTSLSIIDAVESLTDFAELEIVPDIGLTKTHTIVIGENPVSYRSIQWVHHNDIDSQLKHLREIFKVILHYLRDTYRKHHLQIDTYQNIEGIKNIMVLVGEAAKKLDRFKSIFHSSVLESVTDWKEYRQLQDFYLSRIAHHIDEGVLSKWIFGLAQKAFSVKPPSHAITEKSLQTKHVFVDLEAVKKDSEYELFFIRKEDGTRFYSPKLIRNIKLVCDFGDYMGEKKLDDPLADLFVWQDRFVHIAARDLYTSISSSIRDFFDHGIKHKDKEIVERIKNALMALMLCSNPRHLSRNSPPKLCLRYFQDYQHYVRDILETREYQRLVAYPPEASEKEARSVLGLIRALCWGYFKSIKSLQEMMGPIQSLIAEAKQNISQEHLEALKAKNYLWSRLSCDHTALTKLIKRHGNGHLIKILTMLEEGHSIFDPILQGNISCQLYSLYFNEMKIDCVHLPSPIKQGAINKATISPEFKGYINALGSLQERKHLVINLQDKTSWREYERCKVLEETQFKSEFDNHLIVVTLPKDTEFYHQLPPYLGERYSKDFFNTLKTHILEEGYGFFLPPEIKNQLSEDFIDQLAATIHRIFFHNKNILLPEYRLDFIEIFYAFLVLKIIEIIKPSSFSFTCKDGLDIGGTSSSLVFAFLKLLNEEKLSEEQIQYLNTLIYTPSLIVRERLLSPERFKRMIAAIKLFESVREEHGSIQFLMIVKEAFGRLFKTNIFESMIIIPK